MSEPVKRVVVIGAGPGGYVAALRAAQLGAEVTVVERDLVGGTCLNRGCIPTKTLMASVEALAKARGGEEFGFRLAGDPEPVWPAMQARKSRVVEQLRSGIHLLFKKAGVRLLTGEARFVEPRVVEVATREGVEHVEGDAIIIATGSEAVRPAFFDFSQPAVLDASGLLEIEEIPESLLVLGAGPVGCEFACLFGELRTRVTLIELMPQILPQEDVRLARQFQAILRRKGITVLTKTKVDEVLEYRPDGVTVRLSDGQIVSAQFMLVAIGRAPNTTGLGLDVAGVACNERGYILVDEGMRTSASGIYAVGDVVGGLLLAHVAAHEGLVAAENALGGSRRRDLRFVPRCVYTFPEIASVGLSEDEARDEGLRPVTGTFRLGALGKALALGESQGFVQVVADYDTDRLLGATMIGPRVTDVIHEVAVALHAGFSALRLGEVVHAHPTLAEAVMEAAQDVHGESVHVAG